MMTRTTEETRQLISDISECTQGVASWLLANGETLGMNQLQINRMGAYTQHVGEHHSGLIARHTVTKQQVSTPGMGM